MDGTATLRGSAMGADAVLIMRARSGDAAAFEMLLRSRLDRCYRLAHAILGHPEDARDATQEALVAAWRQLPRLRDPDAFDPWLNRVVANAARMSRRHRYRLREVSVGDVSTTEALDSRARAAGADGPAEALARTDAIARCFDRLTEINRVVLVLHYLEARPLAEIAATLGVALGTVKWRLHQARSELEHAMEAEA